MNSRDGAAPTNDLNSENAADAGSVNLSNRFNVLCTDYRFSFQFLFLHVFDVDCWLTMRVRLGIGILEFEQSGNCIMLECLLAVMKYQYPRTLFTIPWQNILPLNS